MEFLYFQNRFRRVSFDQMKSTRIPCEKGVSQGSALEHLLFSLYVNELPDVVRMSSCNLFADDTSIYASALSVEVAICQINEDLSRVEEWCNHYKPGP